MTLMSVVASTCKTRISPGKFLVTSVMTSRLSSEDYPPDSAFDTMDVDVHSQLESLKQSFSRENQSQGRVMSHH